MEVAGIRQEGYYGYHYRLLYGQVQFLETLGNTIQVRLGFLLLHMPTQWVNDRRIAVAGKTAFQDMDQRDTRASNGRDSNKMWQYALCQFRAIQGDQYVVNHDSLRYRK